SPGVPWPTILEEIPLVQLFSFDSHVPINALQEMLSIGNARDDPQERKQKQEYEDCCGVHCLVQAIVPSHGYSMEEYSSPASIHIDHANEERRHQEVNANEQ